MYNDGKSMDIQKILYRHYLEINIPGIVFFFIYTTGQTWAVLRIYHLPIPGDQWATITLLLLLGYISSPSRATFAAMILFALYSLYFYSITQKGSCRTKNLQDK